MKLFLRTILVVLVAVSLTSEASFSQAKSADKKSKTDAPVELKANLMVLDANNAPVNDVKTEDLKLFEDNVEQKLTHFTRRKPGVNLALVVDNTGSLRTQAKIVEEAAALLAVNLDAADEATIIRFTHSAAIEIVEDWTGDKTKLLNAIRTRLYTAAGQSAVIDAVYLAVENLKRRQKSDPTERSAVVLISDCEDRSSYYEQKQLIEHLRGTDIQVFTVALTAALPAGDPYFLRTPNKKRTAESLANSLGGTAGGNTYVVDKVTDENLKNAIRSIMIELRSQYLIGYTPTNQKRGSTRKIRVEVADGPKGEKRQVFVRSSYYVPKN